MCILIYHVFILIYHLSVSFHLWLYWHFFLFEFVPRFWTFVSQILFTWLYLFTILNYFLKIKFLGIEFLSQRLLGDFKSQGAAFSFHFTSERGSKL